MDFIWFELLLILIAVFISKIIADKTNSVDVMWFIVLGVLLGNSGYLMESEQLEFLGDIGIILVMFALGFEEDVENFINGIKKAWGIAVFGAIFPFFGAYYAAKFFEFGTTSALIWGLTMTATAVSLTMVTLKSLNLEKTKAAVGIMTSAVVDDVLSLIGLAILLPIIFKGGGSGDLTIDVNSLVNIFLNIITFFGFVVFVGKYILPYERVLKILFLYKKGAYAYLGVFLLIFLFANFANVLGFHPAIGAYFAGLILKSEYFESEEKNNSYEIEKISSTLAFTVFGPIFFVLLGSKIELDLTILKEILIPTLGLFVAVLITQIFSAALAAKITGGYSNKDSILIGFGMLGRAELAFIVINIAYVQNYLIGEDEFFILMFTTFLLNISVPLLLKMYKPIYERGQ